MTIKTRRGRAEAKIKHSFKILRILTTQQGIKHSFKILRILAPTPNIIKGTPQNTI